MSLSELVGIPTMNTIDDAVARATDILSAAGIQQARVDAELLVGHVLGLSRGGVQAKAVMGTGLSSTDAVAVAGLVERRAARERRLHSRS